MPDLEATDSTGDSGPQNLVGKDLALNSSVEITKEYAERSHPGGNFCIVFLILIEQAGFPEKVPVCSCAACSAGEESKLAAKRRK
ncbi:MAG: hypothetical protein A3K03_11575 [Bdellovibrionales bacterium RIFOXYD1_FULL_44_7]|nr:MAG: hypothetical protein A3K03_11575 [Bdellovibrionales bacterium RIFOXYD1_FULL_44_7]